MTFEPTVLVTSQTAAEIHLAGEVDEVFASTQEGLRSRIVESIRLMAASAGEPVTATVVDGATRWALVVSPDGSFTEATASAADAPASDAAAVPVAAAAPTGPAAAPISAVLVASVPADPAPAVESAATATAVPAAPVADGPLRSGGTRREGAQRTPAQRATPTVDDLLNSRADRARPRATEGWRGAIRRLTGGAISPRPGKAEQSRLDRERLVQRRLDAPRTIVVLNPKGGAHKTTSTLLLAATFGTQRGGATLAWDNNETRGTLGWRAQNAPHHRTAVDLLEDLDRFATPDRASLAALDTYVRTQVDARFDVLASDEDAAASSTIDATAFDRLHDVLSRYYRLLIVDTGNNMRASNWVAAVAAADQLVIVSTVREDTAASAAWLLDGLREKGFDHKIDEAVTILAAPSAKPDRKLAERLERHFSQVTAEVVHVPFDAALVDGGPIDFDALSPETRDAWLTVAASIARRL
ncbi:MinD-like ATPase involved in chromosome partitioning or flagellar assembly [Microbacterium sp. AG790]|uniref:MinD/ParA family ATP-binding protein n=1 Tax=Microbacterium sp. AG790 TaxID=2183995 RepID=UPI000EB2C46D|nr:chromosome partitioning protein [Microbacterium sp. AG790]RKS86692.1 MinD-like ATPase involved in chromosome partitioning or flagellar assembly [Microbacterium sp. AG790]